MSKCDLNHDRIQIIQDNEGKTIGVAVTRVESFLKFPNGGTHPGTEFPIPPGGLLPMIFGSTPEGSIPLIWPRIRIYLAPEYQEAHHSLIDRLMKLPREESEQHFEALLRLLGVNKDAFDLPTDDPNVEIQNVPGWISIGEWGEFIETTCMLNPQELTAQLSATLPQAEV